MGGAKNCPETPRQKMIGMMYLVLTAMLALNVSADIINGFSKLRHSMETSLASTYERTNNTLQVFEAAYNQDESSKAKYGDWWVIGQAIHAKSDEFYNYIEKFKLDIANMCSGRSGDDVLTEMPEKLDKGGDDTNKPHQYALVESDPETGKLRAIALKERMADFCYYMTTAESGIIKEKIDNDAKFRKEWDSKTEMFASLFNTSRVWDEHANDSIEWENSVFSEMPCDAVLAILAKYQNDIRIAENDMINFMYAQTSSSKFVANSVSALVIPTNGEYIMQGDRYRAQIVSAMIDTNQAPRVFINGKEIEGGIYEVGTGAPGEQQFRGYMLVGDDTTHYEFMAKYTVGAPSATLSNLDLNVVYRQYDNPFSISVPGVSGDKISVVCNGAKVTRNGKDWIINPSGSAEKLTIEVKADGKTMGQQVYRVKNLPTPDTYFITASGQEKGEGKIKRAEIINPAAKIEASYGPDGLVQAKFKVTGFKVKLPSGTYTCTGNKMDAKTLGAIKSLKAGQMVFIQYVKAVGPGGQEVMLRSLPLEMN